MSLTFVLLVVFAYLMGSIPFGLLFGRIFADTDVRAYGSKNIGATNVNRILGRKLGAATLLSDILKSLLVVSFAYLLLRDQFLASLVGLAAVVGHCFPVFLKFQGGKGVATAFGAIFVISPWTAVVAMAVWLIVVRLSKISALGALLGGLTIPVGTFFDNGLGVSLVFLGVYLLLVYQHKENIERLRKGEEMGVGSEEPVSPEEPQE